jgi:hypothetical protein
LHEASKGRLEMGDDHKKANIGWSDFKIFLSRTTEPEKNKFA